MPDATEVNLPFPIKGLDRRLAYRRQPPFSTPSCLNVTIDDVYENRARGGTRPGIIRPIDTQLGDGGGQAINFMAQVRGVPPLAGGGFGTGDGPSSYAIYIDGFSAPPMGSEWTAAANAVGLPVVYSEPGSFGNKAGSFKAVAQAAEQRGAVLDHLALLDPSEPYVIQLKAVPAQHGYYGHHEIYLFLDNSGPDPGPNDFSQSGGAGVICRMLAHNTVPGADPDHIYKLTVAVRHPLTGVATLFHSAQVSSQYGGVRTLKVIVYPDNHIEFTVSPTPTGIGVVSVDLSTYGFGGRRMGFGLYPGELDLSLQGITLADQFSVQYFAFSSIVDNDNPPVVVDSRNHLVASAGSVLYITDPNDSSSMIEADVVPTGTDLNFDRNIQGVQRQGKLFIADYGAPKVTSTTGSLTNALVITDTNVNFLNSNIDPFNDVLVIDEHYLGVYAESDPNKPNPFIIPNVYRIVAITENTVQITRWLHFPQWCDNNAPSSGCGAGGGTLPVPDVSYRIERGPKVFDPTIGAVLGNPLVYDWADHRTLLPWNEALVNTTDKTGDSIPAGFFTAQDIIDYGLEGVVVAGDFKGILPVGSRIVCRYRDRMVMVYKNHWYMSRAGDPFDWFLGYSIDDEGRPMSSSLSDGGELGEDITAVMPHTDDYCLFGTISELWVLRGDPAMTGAMERLSGKIGVIDRNAWCYGPQGELFWLSRDGFYRLAPGAVGTPDSISREMIPKELINIDTNSTIVLMDYDVRRRGIDIWLTPKYPEGNTIHYHYAWEWQSFWPYEVQDQMEPWSILDHDSDSETERHLLFGGRDGYIRTFDRNATNDEGVGFDNHVLLGPFQLGENDLYDGILQEFAVAMADASDDATWSVYVGKTPEAAYRKFQNDEPYQTGTLVAGLNPTHRPRARGHSYFFKISSP